MFDAIVPNPSDTTAALPRALLPGDTAVGAGSAGQLSELTSSLTLRMDTLAVPDRPLRLLPIPSAPPAIPASAHEFPVLSDIWDNEEDDLFGRL